jgi:[ribosomal protein S5]-alanine N-acetyltransferase
MSKIVLDTIIETQRLLLRKLCISDVNDMFEYTSNQLVSRYLNWSPHEDITETYNFISQVMKKYESVETEFTYGIELKSEKKLIGVLKILNISYYNKRGEFTSILNPSYQSKGYMGEAWQGLLDFCFNTIGLNRIQSHVTIENIASINKNIKAGLILEGRLKDYMVLKGEYKDVLVYAITSDAFKNKTK